MRSHDVSSMTAGELDCARRELTASLALARSGSPVRLPIEASLSAIDAELAGRASGVLRVCGCAFATDSDLRLRASCEMSVGLPQ